MPVVPGQPIAQADLDALATLASARLLPLVNAAILSEEWPYADYDYFFDGATPQPNYGFDPVALVPPVNLIPNGATFPNVRGGSGFYEYTIVLPDAWGWYDYQQGTELEAVIGNGNITGSIWPTWAAGGAQAVLYSDVPNIKITAKLSLNTKNWMREFNRIRSDFYAMIFNPINGFYLDDNTILSGPWVVGVNDPDTFPMNLFFLDALNSGPVVLGDFTWLGEFYGLLYNFPGFKSMEFWFAQSDDPDGLSISTGQRNAAVFNVDFSGGTWSYEVDYNAELAGNLEATIEIPVGWTGIGPPPADPPDISGFAIDDTSSAGVNWSIQNNPNYPAIDPFAPYQLIGSVNQAIGSGAGSFIASIIPPANFNLVPDGDQGQIITREIFSTAAASQAIAALHPLGNCKKIAANDIPLASNFVLNGSNSTPFWMLSDRTVKGCWVAKTFPTPGQNVFLDQDMPPHVGLLASNPILNIDTAIGENNFGSTAPDSNLPLVSGMRQATPIANQGITPLNPKWGIGNPGLAPAPSEYLVRRDIDFVPYDLGFEQLQGQTSYLFTDIIPISSPDSRVPFQLFIPPDTIKIIVRASAGGTPGWKYDPVLKHSIFQYGDPLPGPITIHFNGDFSKADSEVTVPDDGGPGYLATILNSIISIDLTNPGNPDISQVLLYVEIQTQANPLRQYFPSVWENYSFNFNDVPGFQGGADAFAYPKKVPQNGYCLFKVRASRQPLSKNGFDFPQSNSLQSSILTLGQNILLPDNSLVFTPLLESDGITPITVTIPAGKYDSGDIPVFIPVLGGNELVFQCADDVMLQAWVNWQPIFHQLQFAIGLPGAQGFNAVFGTAFQYAINFANTYDAQNSGYDSLTFNISQFPPSAELYNDLMALLNLI